MSGPYEIDEEHLGRVWAFNEDQRYAYFVAHACSANAVFGLAGGDDGDEWLVWGDEGAERDVFPVWPHPRLAAASATEDFAAFAPAGTDLPEFLRFLEVLEADGLLVGVMPYPDGSQLVVEPADLRRDLEDFASGAFDEVLGAG